MTTREYNEHAVTELKLFVENDSELYHRRAKPIMDNLLRKIRKGTYNPALAPKAFQYLADDGAKKYDKEFAGGAHFSALQIDVK